MEERKNTATIPEEETWTCFSSSGVEVGIDDVFGCFGFKDRDGNIMIEPQFLSCGDFHCGLCPVALGRTWHRSSDGQRYYEMHWGYIDKTGKVRIPFRFREAWDFNRYGVAVVRDEYFEDDYLIDISGNRIQGFSYPSISHYHEHRERFIEFSTSGGMDEGTVGLYDSKERRIVYPPIADDFSELDENCICVDESRADGPGRFKQHYINANGEELYPGLVGKGFDFVGRPNARGLAVVSLAEFKECSSEGDRYYPYRGRRWSIMQLYGVATLDGTLVIPAKYEAVKDRNDGSFECRKGDSVLIIFPERHQSDVADKQKRPD